MFKKKKKNHALQNSSIPKLQVLQKNRKLFINTLDFFKKNNNNKLEKKKKKKKGMSFFV